MNYLFIDFNGKVCMKQERRLHVYCMNNIMAHDSASLHHYINITNFIYIGEISGEPVD